MLTCAKEGVAVRHLRNPPTRSSCVTGKGSLGGCLGGVVRDRGCGYGQRVWLWTEGVVRERGCG